MEAMVVVVQNHRTRSICSKTSLGISRGLTSKFDFFPITAIKANFGLISTSVNHSDQIGHIVLMATTGLLELLKQPTPIPQTQ